MRHGKNNALCKCNSFLSHHMFLRLERPLIWKRENYLEEEKGVTIRQKRFYSLEQRESNFSFKVLQGQDAQEIEGKIIINQRK